MTAQEWYRIVKWPLMPFILLFWWMASLGAPFWIGTICWSVVAFFFVGIPLDLSDGGTDAGGDWWVKWALLAAFAPPIIYLLNAGVLALRRKA